ncbi:glia-derived nexin-like isoform X2 [Antennarius striatus]|uniref:glia-derived nexin-like isoform X2 n=1 Tax=Antennarius striatus TaxID=241820 RepID=UPI0035AF543B
MERAWNLLLIACAVALWYACDNLFSQHPSYRDFGIQVFQQVALSKPLENVVLSPHGVASILWMLLPGAHGETRKQILGALSYKKNDSYKMLKKLHQTLTAISNQDDVLIANAMFVQQGFPMEEAFVAANKANLQCESRNLDFTNPDGAADEINQWINNKTKGHIPSLIKADMLESPLTRLVAVNSIYFKGLWTSRFQPENTKMRPFNGGNGDVYKVPMMSQLSVFNTGVVMTPRGLKYKVIELPYEGNAISMLIVLPYKEKASLSCLIPHISTATVQSWSQFMHMRGVHLFIPKFTADADVDLKAPLLALGITDMFSADEADFMDLSAMPVHVSKALQKAKIEVNEDGTKASAATMDRPFLFLIRHNPTGTILFMGQINQP